MIDNNLIQAALLAKAQSVAAITTALTSGADGIKELNFKGTDFSYPCIRIALEGQIDIAGTNTHCPSQADFSFYVFSEKASSKEANQIAGKVVTAFRGLSFSQSTVKFVKIRILENIPAIAQDERTWRAQIRCQSIISLA
jgi:hypothetical protein